MKASRHLEFLSYVFALAWSDGELRDQERAFMRGLVACASLRDEERGQVEVWFEQAPPGVDWSLLADDRLLGRHLMYESLTLAMSDMEVSAEELAFLDELRERAGLDVPTYHALMQEVEQALIARMKARDQGS